MCWIGTSGCPGPAAALTDQYRWRAGLGSASLSVGLKRLIYSLKYRAKRPGQSRVRRGAEEREKERESPLFCGHQSSHPVQTSIQPFLLVTYRPRTARSSYRGVRKADGGVASPRAAVTDCSSTLAAKEVWGGKRLAPMVRKWPQSRCSQ